MMDFMTNPRSFLTGNEPFFNIKNLGSNENIFLGEFAFETRHEGLIGIPHGGLPMGLALDIWRQSQGEAYPVHVTYKFGGSGVHIGDTVRLQVEKDPEKNSQLIVRLEREGDKSPYLRAELNSLSAGGRLAWDEFPGTNGRDLPFYRNCFVCGHYRESVGLRRRFSLDTEDNRLLACVNWGTEKSDFDRAQYFALNDDELHPAVLISIFDENTAWAGFMITRQCGLSVRMDFTVKRPVKLNEQLFFVGRPAGVKGNPKAPRFFIAEGTVFAVNGKNSPEPIAWGRGEWLIVDKYTQQIKQNLLPENDWEWIFE
jgi:hypothetical protein